MITFSSIIRLLVIGLTETLYVHLSLSWLLDRNKRGRKYYYIMLLVYFLCTIFDADNNFKVYFVFSLAYILIAATAYLFYEGSIGVRLGISFVIISINYACTIFSILLLELISNRALSLPENLSMDIPAQIVLMILCIPSVYLLSVFGKNKGTSLGMSLVSSFILPFTMCVLLLRQFYINQLPETQGSYILNQTVLAALLYVSGVMLYCLTEFNNSLQKSLNYSATLEQMIAMQEKYYTDLQNHQQELRRIKHDIKNHMRVLGMMLDNGEYDEAREYTNTLTEEISNITTPVVNCDNQLISALLNDKLSSAKDNGIEVSSCVMVPTVLSIKSVDLCILLGNLLDSAIEACSNMDSSERKFIDVDIRLTGVFLSVIISNSYSAPLNILNSKYITTKRDKEYHGLGISNVKRVVDKYDGRMTINHEKGIFSVSCLLTYSKEN